VTQQLPLSIALADDATFSNFVGESHHQLTTLLQQAMQGGPERFFYLWGKAGVGKSHLLQACCQAIGAQHKTACYLPLSEYAMMGPGITEGLDAMQLIAIDDIERIAGNAEWEEALFHLYNRVREGSSLLIVSGDAAPSSLSIRLPDLRSRLAWGLVFQIQELSDLEKSEVLMARAKARGLELSEPVALYLLNHCSRHMSDLMAMLDRLDFASLSEQRRLTIPFVKATLL